MFERWMRWIVYGGVFAVLLVPFVVTDSLFFPYITGKTFFFRTIVEIMVVAWGCLAIVNPAYRPKWSPIFVALAAFILVIGIADATGVEPLRSFWSNFERMEGFLTLLHVAALVFVVASTVRSERHWTALLNTSIIASTVLSFHAFSELANAPAWQVGLRVDSTLGNPTYFAVYLLFNIFFALLLAYRSQKKPVLVGVYGIAIIAQFFALYHTQTRGAILGLVAGLGVTALIIAFRGGEYPKLRTKAIVLVLIGVIGLGGFFALSDSSFVQDNRTLARFANISLAETTVQSRITLWTNIAWNGFLDRPILGWGQDNFIIVFGKHYDPIMYRQEPWFDRAHNVFVDWLIAGGALGLLAYLSIFGACLFMIWRSGLPLPERALLVGLLVGYAVNNSFVFDNLISYIYFAFLLSYVHARSLSEYDQSISFAPVSKKQTNMLTAGGAIVALVLIWAVNGASFARAQTLLDAIRYDRNGESPEILLNTFDRALGYGNTTGLHETREQLSQSVIRRVRAGAVPGDMGSFADRAVEELVEDASAEPDNTRPLYFLAHLFRELGRFEEARIIFDQALAINPNRQNFLYEYGDTYIDENNFEDAAEYFKRAYDVETENDTAFGFYVATLVYAGRLAEADALLEDRFGTTIVDNELLFKAYQKQGLVERVVGIFELQLEEVLPPQQEASKRLSLGLAYLELGRREEAIEQIAQAGELHPPFASQAQTMIGVIQAGQNIRIR